MKNRDDIRKDFPILQQEVNGFPLIYFDNAATTQKPKQVIDTVVNFYTTSNANIYRGIYSFAEHATYLYENARTVIAHYIGAHRDEIIFTQGTTSGINFIADTWGRKYIKAGDEIVLTELEHHSNLLPWQRLTSHNKARLNFIPVLPDGTLDLSQLDTIITPKTKLVSVIGISNAVGTRIDLTTIIACAHNVGARVLVDAAQLVPHMSIDVTTLKCDFLAFSGHKMLGPTGIGVLFIKQELHDDIPPYQVGGGMVENVTYEGYTCKKSPHKYEAGTPAIAQAIGLGAAVTYLQTTVDFSLLKQYQANLCAHLIDRLIPFKHIKLLGPLDQLKSEGHLVSFLVKNMHSHDVAAFLNTKGIAVRAGHHCAQPFAHKLGYDSSVRASFYFYNTIDEVDQLVAALGELE